MGSAVGHNININELARTKVWNSHAKNSNFTKWLMTKTHPGITFLSCQV